MDGSKEEDPYCKIPRSHPGCIQLQEKAQKEGSLGNLWGTLASSRPAPGHLVFFIKITGNAMHGVKGIFFGMDRKRKILIASLIEVALKKVWKGGFPNFP
jgi:hypothetical protein